MIIPEYKYTPTPVQLAEDFANLDNDQMLEFFEHVTAVFKRECKRRHLALMDQYVAVVQSKDITQDTLDCLACLVRDSTYSLHDWT